MIVSALALTSIPVGSEAPETPSTAETRAEKEWTFMVYMAADNSLETQGINDLNEMEKIGSNDDLNIIVQFDRAQGRDSSNGDWKETRRYYVTKDDQDDNIIRSNMTADLGEQNMASRYTFKAFMEWGLTEFPAKHYAIIMWDHGDGLTRSSGENEGSRVGFCKDTEGSLKIGDMTWAFGELERDGILNQRIDLVGFDICYGGFFEYAYALEPYVDYYVGSFDEVPDPGWDYSLPLATLRNALASGKGIDPGDYALNILDHYISTYSYGSFDYLTICAIDNREFKKTLFPAMEDLAYQLALNYYYYRSSIDKARSISDDTYGLQCSNPSGKYVDLYHFCENLQAQSDIPLSIKNAAEDVKLNYTKGVIGARHHDATKVHKNNHGPGIYFPLKSRGLAANYYDYMMARTVWGEFLKFYFSPMAFLHRPIPDTEDAMSTHPFKIQVLTEEDLSGVLVISDAEPKPVPASPLGSLENKTYSTTLPANIMNTVVHYYVEIIDKGSKSFFYPPGSNHDPERFGLSYTVGPDEQAPSIFHIVEPTRRATGGDIPIFAKITDNLGVDKTTTKLHYRVGDFGASGLFTSTLMKSVSETETGWKKVFGANEDPLDIYVGYVPSQALGTTIDYFFTANDSSSSAHSAIAPEKGSYALTITGSKGPIMFDVDHASLVDHSLLQAMVKGLGYEVINMTSSLSTEVLKDAKVFVTTEPSTGLEEDEVEAVKDFLHNGGDMLVISASPPDKANTFLDFTGISFSSGSNGTGLQTISNPLPHDLLDGVGVLKVGTSSVKVASDEPGSEILRNNNDALVIANTTWGDGKVAAVADKILDNDHMIYEANNVLAGNILYWLSENVQPVAVITAPQTAVTNTSFSLDGSLSNDPDGSLVEYSWDFGDGSPSVKGKSVIHKYPKKGDYTIKLLVKDMEGGIGISEHRIFVNAAPTSGFTIDTPLSERMTNKEIRFTSTSLDPDGFIVTWEWDFGDGTLSDMVDPNHTYAYADQYLVELIVTDDNGENSTYSEILTIEGDIDIQVQVKTKEDERTLTISNRVDPFQVLEDERIEFELVGSYGSDTTIFWDFGDSTNDVYGKSVEHKYQHQGSFRTLLQIREPGGSTGNIFIYFDVLNVPPDPDIRIHEQDGMMVTFDAGKNIDTENDVLSYRWDFGDGYEVNTTSPRISHTYNYTGEFEITLTVYDDEGAYGTDKLTIDVSEGQDINVFLILLVFLATAALLGLFVYLFNKVLKLERTPGIGEWSFYDPNINFMKLGSAGALVTGEVVFFLGMQFLVPIPEICKMGLLAGLIIFPIVVILSMFFGKTSKGHMYVTREPLPKLAKKVEKILKRSKLSHTKVKGQVIQFDFPQGAFVRISSVEGRSGGLGTLLTIKGRNRVLLNEIREHLEGTI